MKRKRKCRLSLELINLFNAKTKNFVNFIQKEKVKSKKRNIIFCFSVFCSHQSPIIVLLKAENEVKTKSYKLTTIIIFFLMKIEFKRTRDSEKGWGWVSVWQSKVHFFNIDSCLLTIINETWISCDEN